MSVSSITFSKLSILTAEDCSRAPPSVFSSLCLLLVRTASPRPTPWGFLCGSPACVALRHLHSTRTNDFHLPAQSKSRSPLSQAKARCFSSVKSKFKTSGEYVSKAPTVINSPSGVGG
jgi:hypothetical protein